MTAGRLSLRECNRSNMPPTANAEKLVTLGVLLGVLLGEPVNIRGSSRRTEV